MQNQKDMQKVIINPVFALTPAEVEALAALPQHTPDAKLTAEQTRLIENVYYRVFGSNPDAANLLKLEQGQKWKSGEKTKLIDAKRNILEELKNLNHYTGLHATIEPQYFINQIKFARVGVLQLVALVLVISETDETEKAS